MKAEKIIELMVYDSTLAECAGLAHYYANMGSPYDWARQIFSATIEEDDVLVDGAAYIYMYNSDIQRHNVDWFLKANKPNARLKDREEDIIFLWRIENE